MSRSPEPAPNNVAHFSINADDLDRARKFYERVFAWRFRAWGPPGFFMINTGTDQKPGILGSLQQRRQLIPGEPMPPWECSIADVDAVAAAVVANGGTIVLPRTMIPTVGHLIFFKDPEGNVAGAMQYDSHAVDDD